MIKQGVIKPGSPSAETGRPSHFIKDGEALRRGEKTSDLKTLVGKVPLLDRKPTPDGRT